MKKEDPRIIIIVQARMGASRLPGKPLKKVLNKPLLSYELERIKYSKKATQVVVATSTDPRDQAIVDLCQQENVPIFRGSEHDVLDRYYQAAKQFKADIVVRINGDCPLIDPHVIDQVIDYYLQQHDDYVSNAIQRTFPRGMDTEVFSFALLERIAKEAKRPEDREHVTPYFYEHPELFSLGNVTYISDESQHRWTVDTEEDFQLISHLIKALYPQKPNFSLHDALAIISQHPEWQKINAHIQQKPLR